MGGGGGGGGGGRGLNAIDSLITPKVASKLGPIVEQKRWSAGVSNKT